MFSPSQVFCILAGGKWRQDTCGYSSYSMCVLLVVQPPSGVATVRLLHCEGAVQSKHDFSGNSSEWWWSSSVVLKSFQTFLHGDIHSFPLGE